MKKLVIGAAIGGILLFFLQFLSWGIGNFHGSEMQYTEKQDTILKVLGENLKPGGYMIPGVPKGASSEDREKYMSNATGKPWAMVQYHESMSNNMGMNMTRGLLVDIIAVFLLSWFLMKFANLTFNNLLFGSLAVGLMTYLTTTYTNSIWFDFKTIMYLVDAILQWGVLGLWLGWWLPRK